jgi:hypothetical protein
MPDPALLEWIESTNLSTAIREGPLPYPIIGGVHLLSIALFGGMVLITDLRLLGWGMRRRLVSDVMLQLRPWKQLGFAIVVATGLLLTWSEPVRLYGSPAFWVKMVLFALLGVHAIVFRAGVYRYPLKLDAHVTSQAKLAAALSMLLWVGLIVSGRLIAFDASFEPKP